MVLWTRPLWSDHFTIRTSRSKSAGSGLSEEDFCRFLMVGSSIVTLYFTSTEQIQDRRTTWTDGASGKTRCPFSLKRLDRTRSVKRDTPRVLERTEPVATSDFVSTWREPSTTPAVSFSHRVVLCGWFLTRLDSGNYPRDNYALCHLFCNSYIIIWF